MKICAAATLLMLEIALLSAGSCSSPPASQTRSQTSQPELAPLPELNWADFQPALQEKIRPAYQRAERAPADAEAVGKLGMLLHAGRKFEAAAHCYRRARFLAPKDVRWTYYLGIVTAFDDRPAAVELIQAATELAPGYAPAKVRLAGLLLEGGEPERAEAWYRRALAIDPKLAAAHYGLGKVSVALQHWQDAADHYSNACRYSPDYAAAHYALGLAYRKLNHTSKAEASLKRYQQLKDLPPPSFDPVAQAVDEMVAASETTAGPTLDLPASGLEKAAAELERALQEQPSLLSAHSNLIAIYWELGRPEKAAQHYQAALKIDPGDATLHYNWGLMQLLRGDLAAADQALSRALEINSEYADAHVQLGVLRERQSRAEEAVRHYRLALKSNPHHRRAHYHLGRAVFERGQIKDGIRHLEEAIRMEDGETPRFMRVLARAYAHLGDRERALHYIGQARERAASRGMNDLVSQLDSDQARLLEPATASR